MNFVVFSVLTFPHCPQGYPQEKPEKSLQTIGLQGKRLHLSTF